MSYLIGGVPLIGDATDFFSAVHPVIFVFTKETIAPHDIAFEKAVAAHGEQHVAC
ncbi:MAG: hypothetical protein S4CHLAM107_11490 [Chlamydiia bacterium]|nr:hypothetical protein [Chlamydiia bacterium]